MKAKKTVARRQMLRRGLFQLSGAGAAFSGSGTCASERGWPFSGVLDEEISSLEAVMTADSTAGSSTMLVLGDMLERLKVNWMLRRLIDHVHVCH